MIDTIANLRIHKGMNIDNIKTGNIDPISSRVSAALMKCINTAFFTEIMLCFTSISLIQRPQLFTFDNLQIVQLDRGHDRPAATA